MKRYRHGDHKSTPNRLLRNPGSQRIVRCLMATNDRLTLKEAAEVLDMSYGVAKTMRWRGTFPAPNGELGTVPWWYRSTLIAWKRERDSERSA